MHGIRCRTTRDACWYSPYAQPFVLGLQDHGPYKRLHVWIEVDLSTSQLKDDAAQSETPHGLAQSLLNIFNRTRRSSLSLSKRRKSSSLETPPPPKKRGRPKESKNKAVNPPEVCNLFLYHPSDLFIIHLAVADSCNVCHTKGCRICLEEQGYHLRPYLPLDKDCRRVVAERENGKKVKTCPICGQCFENN